MSDPQVTPTGTTEPAPMSFSEWLLQTQQVQEALSKLLGELQNASHQLDNLIQISSSMVKPQ